MKFLTLVMFFCNFLCVSYAIAAPLTYEVKQNYPNPFNPVTTIDYNIIKNSRVSIKIYDILGREVKTLVSKIQLAGRYSIRWNGTNSDGKLVSSGLYFLRMKAGDFVQTRKMLFLK